MQNIIPKLLLGVTSIALVAMFGAGGIPAAWAVSGASFTTFNTAGPPPPVGGCLDNQTGIDCNNYAAKEDVYVSGGPTAAGLADGCYYFAVLVPGFQNGGFIQGADGNLSDKTSGSTAGDGGTGDTIANRTFQVINHQIVTTGCTTTTHPYGTSPNGQRIIELSPYDNTSNPGGVYILAVCEVGATSPSQCKFDAFRAPAGNPGCPTCPQPGNTITVCKYYDFNANGVDDGLPNDKPLDWDFKITDSLNSSQSGTTSAITGCVSFPNLADGSYTVQEGIPSQTNWFNSDPNFPPILLVPNVTIVTEQTTVSGNQAKVLDFGNFCEVPSGGLTLGFWSNKNGYAKLNDAPNGTAPELALLSSEPLVDGNGNDFDPNCFCTSGNCPPGVTSDCTVNPKPLRTWLLSANATNMAYMLSVQLAATKLNVEAGFVDGNAFDLCSGETINALIVEADAALALTGGNYTVGASAARTNEERLKNCLDALNNGGPVVPVNACPHSGFTFPAPPPAP